MRAPSVIIIANPYEGELLDRALADTGLRILRADGGEGAHALIATELPLALVLGTSLVGADPIAIVTEARARHPAISLFLLAEVDDAIATELGTRVTAAFRRPTDFDALAHTIERLAVAAEQAELSEVDESMIARPPPPPPPIPRSRTQPATDPGRGTQPPLVRAHRTETLGEEEVKPAPRAEAVEARLLRADEALGFAGLGFDDVVPARVERASSSRSIPNRSTIARQIDRELSQAERRLFPDATATPLPFGQDDYDDALSDIDLDSLAIDTIPGLAQGFGLDEQRMRAPRRPREASSSVPAEPAPQLRPVQEEGSLAELDVAELIARLHASAFSGALQIERPDGEKVLYVDQGEPIGARSTQRHDQLAELFFREGKLTREQVAQLRAPDARPALEGFEGAARPVALRMVELGLLKDSEIFSVTRRHVEEIFFSLFALETGRYRLGPTLPAADDRVRLSSPMWALVLEGIRRKYGLERLSARLGGRDTVLRPTTLYARAVESARLTADERRVAALVDGERSLGELRAAMGGRVAESVILALAWGLHAIGALETGAGASNDLRYASTVVTTDPGGERRTRPRVVDAEQRNAERAVERDRILSKRAQSLDADYFSILGVPPEASEHELHRAHTRLRADFDPSAFSPEAVAEHAEALAEIREVLDEALRVLLAPVRARYTAHLAPRDESEG